MKTKTPRRMAARDRFLKFKQDALARQQQEELTTITEDADDMAAEVSMLWFMCVVCLF